MLSEMGLVDLMQTVEIGRKTGRLYIDGGALSGVVAFRDCLLYTSRCV